MKTQVAPYATAAWCVRIVCVGGLVVRLTTYPADLTMSNGQVYQTDSGYDGTAYQSTTAFAPAALDIEGFVGVFGITRAQIMSGLFEGARVYIFKCDYRNPVEDYEEITAGLFGKVTLVDDRLYIEGLSLDDTLNQTVGLTVTPACRHSLGDAGCGLTITPATGSITSITSQTEFRDSSRSEAADWFAYGKLQFTSGPNAGLPALDIKRYEADGTIELFESFYYPVSIGDAFNITVGCRKTLAACRDKFNNVVNATAGGFGGFPNVPNPSDYSEIGRKR